MNRPSFDEWYSKILLESDYIKRKNIKSAYKLAWDYQQRIINETDILLWSLKKWHTCSYEHKKTLNFSGTCNKCGWIEHNQKLRGDKDEV